MFLLKTGVLQAKVPPFVISQSDKWYSSEHAQPISKCPFNGLHHPDSRIFTTRKPELCHLHPFSTLKAEKTHWKKKKKKKKKQCFTTFIHPRFHPLGHQKAPSPARCSPSGARRATRRSLCNRTRKPRRAAHGVFESLVFHCFSNSP